MIYRAQSSAHIHTAHSAQSQRASPHLVVSALGDEELVEPIEKRWSSTGHGLFRFSTGVAAVVLVVGTVLMFMFMFMFMFMYTVSNTH